MCLRPTNTSLTEVSTSRDGRTFNNHKGSISWSCVTSNLLKVEVKSDAAVVGARFLDGRNEHSYGAWEYPWFGQLDNNVSFPLEGVGNAEGVNWCNARAPFFISSAGYGVYIADTEEMGYFDFTKDGTVQFSFLSNTGSLTYYIIGPTSHEKDFKSIISTYTSLSAREQMSPDSSYGPTFYSDDFEQDFHGYVTNAEQNYYDVVDHLYYNQIHASALFADRPYGTGNMSFGNFDFDPVFYPNPERLVRNLTAWGYDFQVWVANRAFLYTELYNASVANNWLFPPFAGENLLGPALNLSIPEAYAYFKEHLKYFPSIGVKGYKIDRGEEGEMPELEQNIQDVLFRQLCYESMEEFYGPTGFHNFARSAYDKTKHLTRVWNGDAHSNFTGLAYTVTSSIRAGLLGFSHWTSDTGGYVRGANDPSPELWARWMQFSAFSPEYVLLLGTNHTPWYPPYTQQTLDILKQTANLHHDLIPYIRSYEYGAVTTGVPIVRALFVEEPSDSKAYGINDEYFFGDFFLVAPFVEEGGHREVYFPKGSKYLEYFSKSTVVSGGTTRSISLGVTDWPVYVREGALVVRGDVVQANNKWTKHWAPSLTIEAYPSFDVSKTVFQYYRRDTNRAATITMTTSQKKGGEVTFTWEDTGVKDLTLVVYTKHKPISVKLGKSGQHSITGVKSLFD
ncbi:glycosyl hydrolases family 31-domain-containing protein [Xylogone sp. PMI_703]|nr:glycosyl hydrolases family 31-domain-containing protein [Xylogone sp. PMI_703]